MGDVLDRIGATARRRARAGRHALTSRLGWATLWARLAALGAGVALLAVALSSLSSAEVLSSGDMQVARQGHTATLLADGRIALIGGENASGPLGEAEVYDPVSGIFSPAGSSVVPRASAEVFDPATASFDLVASAMQVGRVQPVLRVLPDGKVQAIGGSRDNSMEIFDPALGGFGAYAQLLSGSTTTPVETILRAQTRAALFHDAQDATLVGAYAPLLDREGHSLTEMPGRNQALVAGGVDTG